MKVPGRLEMALGPERVETRRIPGCKCLEGVFGMLDVEELALKLGRDAVAQQVQRFAAIAFGLGFPNHDPK